MNIKTKPKKLKAPRLYVRTDESYQSAMLRWRGRYAEYRDAVVMAQCASLAQNLTPRGKHWLRAFYSVPMQFVLTDEAKGQS